MKIRENRSRLILPAYLLLVLIGSSAISAGEALPNTLDKAIEKRYPPKQVLLPPYKKWLPSVRKALGVTYFLVHVVLEPFGLVYVPMLPARYLLSKSPGKGEAVSLNQEIVHW